MSTPYDGQAQFNQAYANSQNQMVKARQPDPQQCIPTDRAILGAVALHFKVSDADAFRWLVALDAKALQAVLIEEHGHDK